MLARVRELIDARRYGHVPASQPARHQFIEEFDMGLYNYNDLLQLICEGDSRLPDLVIKASPMPI